MINFNNQTVVQIFEQQVLSNSERVAVSDQLTALTYRQLNEKANCLAHYLLNEAGVSKGDFVALLLEPGVDFIICILGIIKAGAAYLPLDVLSPKKRLEKILDDASPRLLIIDEKHDPTEFGKWPKFSVKNLQKLNLNFSGHNPINYSAPSDPVYMLYTSGSTGEPKGALIPHRAVVNLTKTVNYADVKKSTIVAQFSHIAFDASTFEIWSALLNGATLAIASLKTRQNHLQLKQFLLENHVQYLFLPTGYFHQLIRLHPDAVDGIQTLIIGGEKADVHVIEKLFEYRKSKELPLILINGYGPTEATVFTCQHIMDSREVWTQEKIDTIGKSIPNVKLYVLGQSQQLVQPGDIGELCISGINLALAYYHDCALNEKKLIDNPFDDQPPFQKLYKTGDMVKQLPDGNYVYIGRRDDQVKIQGFRVHISEIEAQLLHHPAISAAIVLPEKDANNCISLTAYVIFSNSENIIESDQIKKYLSAQLPSYMRPNRYVKINQMPLTAVGKIDKKRLPEIEGIDLENIKMLPSITIEKQLATTFAKLLKVNDVDVTQNLFDLGVNSLLLIEAYHKISRQFQRPPSLEAIITYPSIRKLSDYMQQAGLDRLNNSIESA